jgi:hypothetical protein
MTEQKNKMQYYAPAEKRNNKIPHNDDTINDAEHEFYKSLIGQKGSELLEHTLYDACNMWKDRTGQFHFFCLRLRMSRKLDIQKISHLIMGFRKENKSID